MKYKVNPCGDKVVFRDASEDAADHPLILPDGVSADLLPYQGVVLAVGPDVCALKVDDKVIIDPHAQVITVGVGGRGQRKRKVHIVSECQIAGTVSAGEPEVLQ